MKGCLVCYREVESDAATCPGCGESSFTAPFQFPGETVRIERPALADQAEAAQPRKKGRR